MRGLLTGMCRTSMMSSKLAPKPKSMMLSEQQTRHMAYMNRRKRGLYGKKETRFGNNVSHSLRRTRRMWRPNIQWKRYVIYLSLFLYCIIPSRLQYNLVFLCHHVRHAPLRTLVRKKKKKTLSDNNASTSQTECIARPWTRC